MVHEATLKNAVRAFTSEDRHEKKIRERERENDEMNERDDEDEAVDTNEENLIFKKHSKSLTNRIAAYIYGVNGNEQWEENEADEVPTSTAIADAYITTKNALLSGMISFTSISHKR